MKNQIKTVLFLGLLSGLLLGVGSIFGRSGLIIALVIAVGINFFSYFFSDKIVLRMYHAKEAKKSEYPKLHGIVEELSHKAGIPKPRVYIIPTIHSNAMATGRNPKHAVVACTQGIMDLLTEDELKGVLAHEISHVKNRDILISSIAATIAAVIAFAASMARFAAIFGGFGGRDNNGRGNLLEILILSIITPIIATIIQLAVTRSREFLADETGARIIRNGLPLASALEKLDGDIKKKSLVKHSSTAATAHMFISNPFAAKNIINLFSTHPSTQFRVERLRKMKF